MATHIPGISLCSLSDEKFSNFCAVVEGSDMQRGPSIVILSINIGALGDELFSNF